MDQFADDSLVGAFAMNEQWDYAPNTRLPDDEFHARCVDELLALGNEFGLTEAMDEYSKNQFGEPLTSLDSGQLRGVQTIFLPLVISIKLQLDNRVIQ